MIPGSKKRIFSFHDVLMYVAMARKHLRLMCLLMCLANCAGLLLYVFSRPVYYSKALIAVHYVARPIDTDKLYQDGRWNSVVQGLTSGPVIERSAHVLGVDATAREIRANHVLKVGMPRTEDGNMEMEVWSTHKDWTRRWASLVVKEWLAYRQEWRISERQKIVDSYTKEMAEVSGKMTETLDERFQRADEQKVTQTMIQYAGVRGVPTELIRLTSLIDEVGRVRLKLQDPDLDVIAKLSLIFTLKDKANLMVGQEIKFDAQPQPEPDAANPPAGADGKEPKAQNGRTEVVVIPTMQAPAFAWQELEKRQQAIKSQIAEKSRLFLPGNLKMVALRKQLDEVERALNVELDVAQNRLALEHQDLLNRRAEMEAKLPEYEAMNKKTLTISRDSHIYDATQLPWVSFYTDMKRRLEALDYAGERERIDLTYHGLLDVHELPVSPNRTKSFLLSLFLGLMLAIAVPFLIEYLDHTLTNLEQVESTFQLRALGIVPKMREEATAALPAAGSEEKEGANLVENFRVIRTNLISMGNFSKPPHVLMVTSAMPKEGKTVVSSNLAISFAQTGARTLIIDTDLRRGRLHRLFGYRKSPGLSDVLLGQVPLAQALRSTGIPNLTILSAGKHLNNGTELLGSALFTDLMTGLRGSYERIIIDTPPVLGLSETSIMQPHVDGAVFVIWSGRTPIRNMKAAIELLQSNGANFYGFVLNRLDLNATTNYYQYYYYSHDYYYHSSLELENA